MRAGLIFVALSLLPSPAVAQTMAPAAPARPKVIQVSPATADRLADTVQVLSQALLDLRIGAVQAAIEGRRPTQRERELTVRDLARRDDPDFDRHLDQRIAEARPKIEQGIRAFNEALPEVTQDLQRAHEAVQRAIANMPDPNYPRR